MYIENCEHIWMVLLDKFSTEEHSKSSGTCLWCQRHPNPRWWNFLSAYFLGRLIRVNWMMSVHRYVWPSTKSFSSFNNICHLGKGWCEVFDSMLYDLIRGHYQSHWGLKFSKMANFKVYLSHQYDCNQQTNCELWYKTISKLQPDRFLILFVFIRLYVTGVVS